MTFLPDNAQEPKSKSNYTMPLEEGTHRLRVIGSAIVGYEGWKKEGEKNTPIRYKIGTQPDKDPNGKDPKYFWSFLVWNYEQERVQIMCITQKTIREAMQDLINNPAWGNPQEYDIALTRKGTKLDDTSYSVMPNPKTPAPEVKSDIDLQVWMRGDDPFSIETPEVPTVTPNTVPTRQNTPPVGVPTAEDKKDIEEVNNWDGIKPEDLPL